MDTTLGEAFYDLTKVVRLIKQRRAIDRPHLPPGVIGTMLQIEATGASGCHAKDLAARTGLDPSTVSRAVAGLVGHGLVERRADPDDKRATVLALTPAGRSALAEAQDWYRDVLERALADWHPDERAALTAALGRLVNDLEKTLIPENDPSHLEAMEAAR